VDKCNQINENRGYRNKEKAQQYLRKSRVQREFGRNEKIRIVDSMLTVFATKHNIDPKGFGFMLVDIERKSDQFMFLNREESAGDESVFGYIYLTEKEFSKYQGVEFFDEMVEKFARLEENPDFIDALNQYRGDGCLNKTEDVYWA
jgi:hypothetical protein